MPFWRKSLTQLLVLATLTSCTTQNSQDEKAIEQSRKAYEEAFNNKDVKTLGELWAEDGTYVTPESGIAIHGKTAILDKFTQAFTQNPTAKIEIHSDPITFINTNEAIEVSRATVKEGDDILAQTAYRTFYEKINGRWVITEIREVLSSGIPSPSEHLKDLEWLIGSWDDTDDDSVVSSEYQWDKYKHFILHTFTVVVEGTFELEGKQVIGWDPIHERIHSWIFDSDGGFGEGNWKKQGNNWVVETVSTLTNGKKASAINIYTPVDDSTYIWQSTGRSVGAEPLPDIEPVNIIRRKK